MDNPLYIERPSYLKKVQPFISKPLIKVFTGQRRSGKSYLLLQTQDYIQKEFPGSNIIFINKELPDYQFIRNDSDLWEYIDKQKNINSKNFVFIDEIQEIVGFEKALRGMLASGEFDIYCTGSNAGLLSGELATLLSGRFIEIKVSTLSYYEFLTFYKLANSTETLLKYIRQGGMPFLIHLDDDESVRHEYLRNVLNSIVYKDIVQRFNVRNFSFLQNLMVFLADNTGSLLSANRINEYLKSQRTPVSVATILDYLFFLESAYLVHKVKRYDIEGKRLFEINDKFYFEDLGIRNTLKFYDPAQLNKLIENVTYKHLSNLGYSVFVGKIGDREIDFIGQKDEKTIYVQVAQSTADPKTFDREFGNLLLIPDNHPKYVVTLDEYATGNHEGIFHLHLKDFLMAEV